MIKEVSGAPKLYVSKIGIVLMCYVHFYIPFFVIYKVAEHHSKDNIITFLREN